MTSLKRIRSACLNLTVLFDCRQAYDQYMAGLAHKRIPCHVVSEQPQEGGGWLVSLKKPYNGYDYAGYFEAVKERP